MSNCTPYPLSDASPGPVEAARVSMPPMGSRPPAPGRAEHVTTVAAWSATAAGVIAYLTLGHLLPALLAAMAAAMVTGAAYGFVRGVLGAVMRAR